MDVANKPKILLEMGSVSVAFRQASFVGSWEFKHTSQLWRQPKVWGQLADKITKPSSFIVFAPTQDNSTTVHFQGTAATPVLSGYYSFSGNEQPRRNCDGRNAQQPHKDQRAVRGLAH